MFAFSVWCYSILTIYYIITLSPYQQEVRFADEVSWWCRGWWLGPPSERAETSVNVIGLNCMKYMVYMVYIYIHNYNYHSLSRLPDIWQTVSEWAGYYTRLHKTTSLKSFYFIFKCRQYIWYNIHQINKMLSFMLIV